MANPKLLHKLTKQEAEARTREERVASDYRSAYANNVSVTITPWDFRFQFGKVQESDRDRFVLEHQSEVFLSPPQAKALLKVLQNKVDQYEEELGKILDLGKLEGKTPDSDGSA
jgi:flagellar protein FlaG